MKKSRTNLKSAAAFTLIETMLAIGIMAMVIVVMTGVFFSALHLRDHTMSAIDEAQPANQAVSILRRDLICAIAPAGYLCGDFKVGLLTEISEPQPVAIEMFTATGALRENEPWADLQMVTYELKPPATPSAKGGNDLYRSVTRNLLSTATPEVEEQFLMSDVQTLQFSCYDGAQWQDTWDTTMTNTNLPQAVRVTIQLAGAAATDPILMVVPIVAQSRTNKIVALSSAGT